MQDPKEWVSIEEVSGLLTISKVLDREAMTPRNDLYNITVMAIDQGNKVLIKYFIIEWKNKLQLFFCRNNLW